MICSNCGEEFVGNFCPRCGQAVFADQEKTKCPNCGIEFSGNFCPNCGHSKSTDISHINSLPPTNEQPKYENPQNTQPPISITINNSNRGAPSASTAHSPSAKNKMIQNRLFIFLFIMLLTQNIFNFIGKSMLIKLHLTVNLPQKLKFIITC